MKVRVTRAAFGLTTDKIYDAEKVTSGFNVAVEGGGAIFLPDEYVTVAEALQPREPIPQQPVQEYLSEAEQQAIAAAKGTQQPTAPVTPPPIQQGGVMSQILQNDSDFSPVGNPQATQVPLTPAGMVAQVLDAELIAARKNLIPPAQPLLKEGQCWLSDLTNGTLPKSGVDHIITAYKWDHFPEPLRADIPEFNVYHEWDADVLENIHLAHTENVKNLLVGFPGAGKTTSSEQYAAIVLQPFMRVNGKSGIDGSSFLGFLWAGNNGTAFSEGLLPTAMRNGYLLVIDEVFKIPAEIQMNFQTVYEENGFLLLDEKPGAYHEKLVKPHPDFRLVSTDNAKGVGDNFDKFGATQNQDTSTLDRFQLTCNVPYLEHKTEWKALMRMYPEVEQDAVDRFVQVANLIRTAYSQSNVALTLSMRGLKMMCRLWMRGISEKDAFEQVYLSKLADDDEINTAKGFSDTTVKLSDTVPMKGGAQPVPAAEEKTQAPWEKDRGTDVPF